jgi:hypothetical protein
MLFVPQAERAYFRLTFDLAFCYIQRIASYFDLLARQGAG